MRLYVIGQELSAIPKLLGGQTPNISKVIPNIDLKDKPEVIKALVAKVRSFAK